MKDLESGKYSNYPFDYCDRCGEKDEIRITTDGGHYLCELCARKMIFDSENPIP